MSEAAGAWVRSPDRRESPRRENEGEDGLGPQITEKSGFSLGGVLGGGRETAKITDIFNNEKILHWKIILITQLKVFQPK